MKNLTLLALAVVATGAFVADLATGQDYLPLERGNSWTLADPASTRDRQDVAVTYTWRRSYHWMTGFQGKSGFWTYRYQRPGYTSPYLWNFDSGRGTWSTLFRFDNPIGASWTTRLQGDACDLGLHLQATGLTVQTPAGRFTGCRRYDFTVRDTTGTCPKPAWASVVLAPGVGIVEVSTTDGRTLQAWDLQVGGATYPTPPSETRDFAGVELTLGLDAYRYENVPNTIRCITFPCPGNEVTAEAEVSLGIANNTTGGLNAPGFDVEVREAGGKVVLTAGLAYNRMRSMLPGERRTLKGTLELRDAQGSPLRPGAYTMVARLLGTTDPVEVPFYVVEGEHTHP